MKALVSGAGIAGLTLASWLGRAGWEVVLVEKAPGLRDEGYMIDFMGSGYDVAERMDLIPRLREVAYDIPDVKWIDADGRTASRLDYHRMARMLDGRLLSLMRGDLEHVLHAALPPSTDLRFATTISAIEQTGDTVAVHLSSGVTERADLVVGADGIHSHVRRTVFGDEQRFSRYLGYHTAAFIYEDAEAVASLGNQFKLMTLPGRQAGFYPIRGGKVAAFFAHAAENPALPEHPVAELRRVYGDLGWLVPNSLDHAERLPGIYYDQIAQIEMEGWSRGNVTLIGDACDAVSLLAGQGASLAMGTAYVLAEELGRAAPVAAALTAYEKRLIADVRAKQASGRNTARWLVPRTRLDIAIRNWVLRIATLPGLSTLMKPLFLSGTESVIGRR